MTEVEKHAAANVNKVLIGNKLDLSDSRKVTKEEGAALAKHYGMKFIETSARTSSNVHDAFKMMATEIQTRIAAKPTPGGKTFDTSAKGT